MNNKRLSELGQPRDRRPDSSREFLFYKTGTAVRKNKTSLRTASAKSSEIFSKNLKGQDFADAMADRLASSISFAVIIIRADTFHAAAWEKEGVAAPEHAGTLLTDMAGILNLLCKKPYAPGSMWGMLDHGIFGCFLPEKDEDFCMKFTNEIRTRLTTHRNETLTAGVALFPFLHFSGEQIIENAWKALDHAAFACPDSTVLFDTASLNIRADRLYEDGDIPGAAEELETAIRLDPSNTSIYNNIGVCHGIMGGFEKALGEFEKAVLLNPREMACLYNAGLVYLLMGKQEKALEYFHRAERIGKDVFELVFQMGRLYLDMEKPETGKKFLEKATELRPDSGQAFRCLGECYAALDMTKAAIRAYHRAIRQNPYDAASLSAIGYLFDLQEENPEIPLLFCQYSVGISPDCGLYRYRLGRLYLRHDRPVDALKEFVRATELGYDARDLIREIQQRRPDEQVL